MNKKTKTSVESQNFVAAKSDKIKSEKENILTPTNTHTHTKKTNATSQLIIGRRVYYLVNSNEIYTQRYKVQATLKSTSKDTKEKKNCSKEIRFFLFFI